MAKQQQSIKGRVGTWFILIFILLVLGGLVAFNYLYLNSAQVIAQKIDSGRLPSVKIHAEVSQLQERLTNNSKFQELIKIGNWPLEEDKIEKGQAEPFK